MISSGDDCEEAAFFDTEAKADFDPRRKNERLYKNTVREKKMGVTKYN